MLAYSPVKAQDCAGKVGVHTFMTLVLRGIFLVRRWLPIITLSYLSHHSKYIRCGRYICLKPAVVCMLSHCILDVILYIVLPWIWLTTISIN